MEHLEASLAFEHVLAVMTSPSQCLGPTCGTREKMAEIYLLVLLWCGLLGLGKEGSLAHNICLALDSFRDSWNVFPCNLPIF